MTARDTCDEMDEWHACSLPLPKRKRNWKEIWRKHDALIAKQNAEAQWQRRGEIWLQEQFDLMRAEHDQQKL